MSILPLTEATPCPPLFPPSQTAPFLKSCLQLQQGGTAASNTVRFENVYIREHAMTIGDNPAVSHGAPVQIEWDVQDVWEPIELEEYEASRSQWRSAKRRGYLMNGHRRCKVLLMAGISIDEIAEITLEMQRLRKQRAESLKSEGISTAIWELLSGAAETTGHTVRKVQILPNAVLDASKVVVHGTGKAVGGLTSKVIEGTAKGAKMSGEVIFSGVHSTSRAVTGATLGMAKGTGKVVVGTGKVATDVVVGTGKLTGKVVVGTGKLAGNAVVETGKFAGNAVVGTGKFAGNAVVETGKFAGSAVVGTVKGTATVGKEVVRGTGKAAKWTTQSVTRGAMKTTNVVTSSTTALVKGTGLIFVGTGRAGLEILKQSGRAVMALPNRVVGNDSNHSDSDLDHQQREGESESNAEETSERSSSKQSESNSSVNNGMNTRGNRRHRSRKLRQRSLTPPRKAISKLFDSTSTQRSASPKRSISTSAATTTGKPSTPARSSLTSLSLPKVAAMDELESMSEFFDALSDMDMSDRKEVNPHHVSSPVAGNSQALHNSYNG